MQVMVEHFGNGIMVVNRGVLLNLQINHEFPLILAEINVDWRLKIKPRLSAVLPWKSTALIFSLMIMHIGYPFIIAFQ